jgi:hypothetical protein
MMKLDAGEVGHCFDKQESLLRMLSSRPATL